MDDTLRIRHLSNCCLQIISGDGSIIIDGPYEDGTAYDDMDPEELRSMMQGTGVYSAVRGLLFTHIHPDHYSASKASACAETNGWTVISSDPDMDARNFVHLTSDEGSIALGNFVVRYYRATHLAVTASQKEHNYVFVIETRADKRILITGDAGMDEALLEYLGRFSHYTCAFLNLLLIHKKAWRDMISSLDIDRTYIYHIPSAKADVFSYRDATIRTVRSKGLRYELLLEPDTFIYPI